MTYLAAAMFVEQFVCKFLKLNWYWDYLRMVTLYIWFMINCEHGVYHADTRNKLNHQGKS